MVEEQRCAEIVIRDDGRVHLSLCSSEDSEHMAGWTVEHDNGVSLGWKSGRHKIAKAVPKVIECRQQERSTSPLCTTMNGKNADFDGLMDAHQEREEQEPSATRDHSTPTRYRTASPNNIDDFIEVRLSLAGLQPGVNLSRQSSRQSSSHDDELLDELHSDQYCSVIEKLRLQLGDCIPAVDEEMISKAVIHAFSSEPCSGKSEPEIDKYQVEVDLLWEAHQWAHQHSQGRDERAEQDFLQECLNKTFLQIHRERLSSSNRALRILVGVGTILGLEIEDSVYRPQDTVLLLGLPRGITRKSLHKRLSAFGTVRALAISSANSDFAYCRFREEASASRVIANRGSLGFRGTQPRVSMLDERSHRDLSSKTSVPDSPRSGCAGEDEDELQISPNCVSKHVGNKSYWKQEEPEETKASSSSWPFAFPFLP